MYTTNRLKYLIGLLLIPVTTFATICPDLRNYGLIPSGWMVSESRIQDSAPIWGGNSKFKNFDVLWDKGGNTVMCRYSTTGSIFSISISKSSNPTGNGWKDGLGTVKACDDNSRTCNCDPKSSPCHF